MTLHLTPEISGDLALKIAFYRRDSQAERRGTQKSQSATEGSSNSRGPACGPAATWTRRSSQTASDVHRRRTAGQEAAAGLLRLPPARSPTARSQTLRPAVLRHLPVHALSLSPLKRRN